MDLTPPRLSRALDSLQCHREAGLHLVGIRHHSPGCSAALRSLLEEVRPRRVLIEGPREYTALLGALADERTRPPVAVLSLAGESSAFYPLAEFSPEWVALRWGSANGAVVDFIDQSWADQRDIEAETSLRTLQAEHHLARSEAIARLASRLGCRDHDEVWEHLFELRTPADLADWRRYHSEVLAWAALARLEAGREALSADGTLAREAVMLACLRRHLAAADGPVVVVTGAFHTLALLEALDQTPEGRWVSELTASPDADRPAWLIRYDNLRLDALRGYGAGMPSPGFWQRAWAELSGPSGASPGRDLATSVLLDVAARLRGMGEVLSTAEVSAAVEQASRLADLRGRAWPGRTDLLDAMVSCFVSDDTGGEGPLREAVDEVFGGGDLGELPPGMAQPPLVAQARETAEQLRFRVTDGQIRQASLDTARKPGHVGRRQFLATMRFLGTGFARQVGGADLVAGVGGGQLVEEWEYAWTPLVEAALVQLSHRGATLAEVRRREIVDRLAGGGLSAPGVATLIAELLVMGSASELPPALAALRSCFDSEATLAGVVDALHRLAALLASSGRLALGGQEEVITELMATGLAAAAYRLGPLAGIGEDETAPACSAVLSLRSLLRRIAEPDLAGRLDVSGVGRELALLRGSRRAPARLHGTLVATAFSDRQLDAAEFHGEVLAHLSPGTDPDRVAGFLLGMMQATPDVIVHDPDLLGRVNDSLAAMSEESFLRVLPDLRQAFTWLRPTETARVAERVSGLTGAGVEELDALLRFDPAQAARAQRVEGELVAGLVRDRIRPDGEAQP